MLTLSLSLTLSMHLKMSKNYSHLYASTIFYYNANIRMHMWRKPTINFFIYTIVLYLLAYAHRVLLLGNKHNQKPIPINFLHDFTSNDSESNNTQTHTRVYVWNVSAIPLLYVTSKWLCCEAVGECERNFHIIRIYLWYGGGWVVGVAWRVNGKFIQTQKIYICIICMRPQNFLYKRMCKFRFPIEETPNSTRRRRQNCCLLCARALAIADRTHYNVSIFWPLRVSQQRVAHVKLKWKSC